MGGVFEFFKEHPDDAVLLGAGMYLQYQHNEQVRQQRAQTAWMQQQQQLRKPLMAKLPRRSRAVSVATAKGCGHKGFDPIQIWCRMSGRQPSSPKHIANPSRSTR